jgi:hypothetical protein
MAVRLSDLRANNHSGNLKSVMGKSLSLDNASRTFIPQIFNEMEMSVDRRGREITFPPTWKITLRYCGSMIMYLLSSTERERDLLRCGLLWGCHRSPLPPGRILVLISVRGWVDARAIVGLERLGLLKNPMTSSEIETSTFRLVATVCP